MPSRVPPRAPAWFLWSLAGAVFLGDWLTKRWVVDALSTVHSRDILGDFVRFSYVRNRGAAFGLFAERGWPLTWVNVAALAVVLWMVFRPVARRWPYAVSLGLILGGAVGNLFDRLRWGSVVDFVDVGIGGARFWVFNLADSAISVGVALWAVLLVFSPPQRGDAAAGSEASPRSGEAGDAPPPGSDDARGA
jgi:signal peptidase II